MVRNNANDLYSNEYSTPIIAFQHNSFRECYFKGTYSLHLGSQEFKAGAETDNIFLHENFNYTITDPTQFDDGTSTSLSFTESRPYLEQSAFVEDLIHLGDWTVSAGLRWDHYQLILNQNALSPRVSIGQYLPSIKAVLHASYDRVFQTPSFENILISSSPAITSLDPSVLRLPVKPSTGTYYEGGIEEGLSDKLKLDVNFFRRDERNYADDDQLLVEAKAGRHFTHSTPNRKGPEFAKMIQRLAHNYPHARTIHLVVDNLNTHCRKSLERHFGIDKAKALWERFTVHHTPKHASWLNQAEVEISLFSRQCLGQRRIPSLATLRPEAKAWNQRIHRDRIMIQWKFSRTDAQKSFHYQSNLFVRSEH